MMHNDVLLPVSVCRRSSSSWRHAQNTIGEVAKAASEIRTRYRLLTDHPVPYAHVHE